MGVEDAQAQQVEASTTVHLALEHLEPVDVTFDRSITPRQTKCGHDSSLVSFNRERETGECRVTCLFQPSRPGRDVALRTMRKNLEQTARKTATDRHLLTALHDIIRNAARDMSRAIGREAPNQQQRIEPQVVERLQADQLREVVRAASPLPVSKPVLVAQQQFRIEPVRPVVERPKPDPQPPPKAKPDRPPSLMDIYKERAAKVRTTREEPRGRELRQELQPPARRRGLEDEPMP